MVDQLYEIPLIDGHTYAELFDGTSGGDTMFQPKLISPIIENPIIKGHLWDAIVATDGTGEFILPSQAINAGRKSIFIKDGTYDENTNGGAGAIEVAISSGTYIHGESRDGVIILCPASETYLYMDPDIESGWMVGVPDEESITITKDDATVTGDNTTFTNLSAGDDILIRGIPYAIASITDNTHLELNRAYQGQTDSGLRFAAGALIKHVTIENITFTAESNDYMILMDGTAYCTVRDCTFKTNLITAAGGEAIYMDKSGSNTIENCESIGMFDNGLLLFTDACLILNNKVRGCYTGGIFCAGEYNKIIGNHIASADDNGIEISDGNVPANYNIIVGNTVFGCSSAGITVGGIKNLIDGNVTQYNSTDINVAFNDINYLSKDNIGNLYWKAHEFVIMGNNSGSDVVAGDVVVFQPSSGSGNNFTTTTTVSDAKVVGIAAENIANGLRGEVQVGGYTRLVKVNGTTDIAVGDFLTTYSEVGIAKKAESNEVAFAIAMEAYSTNNSSGVLNALLISPRIAGTGKGVTTEDPLTDHAIIRGDGGVEGVQDSGIIIDDTDNVTGIGNIIPKTDSTYDLGTSAPLYFANAYLDKVFLNSTASIDGTVAGSVTFNGVVNVNTNDIEMGATGSIKGGAASPNGVSLKFDNGVFEVWNRDENSRKTGYFSSVWVSENLAASDAYATGVYATTHYLNATAYLNGASAGKIIVTGVFHCDDKVEFTDTTEYIDQNSW